MFRSMEDAQRFTKDNLDVTARCLSAVSKGLQAIAADAADYTKRSFEASSVTFEKLMGAKSLDKAVEIQSEYARDAYEALVAQTTRIGGIVTDMAKESCKPFEGIIARASGK
jgi:hypothetical protein